MKNLTPFSLKLLVNQLLIAYDITQKTVNSIRNWFYEEKYQHKFRINIQGS